MLRFFTGHAAFDWERMLVQVLPERFLLGALLIVVGTVVDLPWLDTGALPIVATRFTLAAGSLLFAILGRHCKTRAAAEAMVIAAVLSTVAGFGLIGWITGAYLGYTAAMLQILMFTLIFLPLRPSVFVGLVAVIGVIWFVLFPAVLPLELDARLLASQWRGYLLQGFMFVVGNRLFLGLRAEERAHSVRLEELSARDELTGLYNFRHFQTALPQLLACARDESRPLSLCIVDLDNFKVINDTYGHLVGNDVLQRVARTLQSGVRENDLVARIGGDEFAVILPGASAEAAQRILERIQKRLAESDGDLPSVGCSVGIAEDSAQWQSPGALLEAADQASYKAKERRGQVVIAGPPSPGRP